jgi:5-methylcytosine-specific restriction endonuclease McrA
MSTAEIQDAVRDAISEQLPRIRRIEHDRLAYTSDLAERWSVSTRTVRRCMKRHDVEPVRESGGGTGAMWDVDEALEAWKKQSGISSGSTLPKGERFKILRRDDYQCQLCGRTAEEDGVKLHVDHKVPKAKGGTNDPDNLWVLCKDCNLGKGTKSL